LTFRLGKQIIEWGELIAPVEAPGVNVLNMFDTSKAGAAGYTFRDYKVPTMSGWLSWEATNYLSLEAVYSQDFDPKNAMPIVGTFQSFINVMGWGGPTMGMDVQIPTGSEDRQYGAAARMVIPGLRNLELGFYYAHYIDYMPFIDLDMATFQVKATYEELDMYGLSFSQAFDALGGFSLYGELTYRPNQAAQLFNVLGPVGGFQDVRKVNWGFGGMWMLSDFFDFTPWTVTFSPMLDFYGGYNLDYDQADFFFPESGAWYRCTFDFRSSDIVDNTILSLTFALSGGLHEEEKSYYSLGTTLTARIGDNLGLMLGYDIKGGDPEDAIKYPGWLPDRDAVTLGITWYFM
jgi:hypothetical protein